MNDLCGRQNRPKSFRPTPELNEEEGRLPVTAQEPQAAYLVRSETVAKFSSFRQVKFRRLTNSQP
jgi:hypothetical protein